MSDGGSVAGWAGAAFAASGLAGSAKGSASGLASGSMDAKFVTDCANAMVGKAGD
jgi:hypothetical protein